MRARRSAQCSTGGMAWCKEKGALSGASVHMKLACEEGYFLHYLVRIRDMCSAQSSAQALSGALYNAQRKGVSNAHEIGLVSKGRLFIISAGMSYYTILFLEFIFSSAPLHFLSTEVLEVLRVTRLSPFLYRFLR